MSDNLEHITAADRIRLDPRGLERITKIAGAVGSTKLSHETFIMPVRPQPDVEHPANLQNEPREES